MMRALKITAERMALWGVRRRSTFSALSLSPDVIMSSAFVGEHGAHRIDRRWPDWVQEAIDAL